MTPIVLTFLKIVDGFNSRVGKLASFLILVLVSTVALEVFARYLFNSPFGWSYKMTSFLWGGAYLLGGAWVLKEGRHVSVDILSSRLSPRGQAILSIISYCLLFLPFMIVLLWKGADNAVWSWTMMEKEYETEWMAPLYPIKTLIPIAFAMLLLQGIASIIRSIIFLVKGREEA